jgi:adenylate kinase family enzyme
MQKVIVIGCPGAGKSYFSRRLAEAIGLPLIHLDAIYHQKIWDDNADRKREQWRANVLELLAGDAWIIDGNYKSTFDIRMPAADTIIFLDYPRWLTLVRAFRRRWEYRNRRRSDMPEEWTERISWDFLAFIWTYRKKERPRVLDLLRAFGTHKDIYIIGRPTDATTLLRRVEASGCLSEASGMADHKPC